MERLYYIASDSPLPELKNPYVTYYSVKEALDKGIELEAGEIKGIFGVKAKKTIEYCEDDTKLGYPCTYKIKKRNYKYTVTAKRKHCYKLETDLKDEYAEILIGYFKECLELTDAIELYSVLLDESKSNVSKETQIGKIDSEFLIQFLSEDVSENKLIIKK